MGKVFSKLGLIAAAVLGAPAALAAQPEPWGVALQPAATEKMVAIENFHDLLVVIITTVTLFVLALLIYVMIRYNKRANPVPSKTTHNSLIEVVWTVVPVVILIVIAIPSFKLLYANEKVPPGIELTIKAIGKQWFWTYEYPDNGNFTFDATMLSDAEAAARGEPRLLAASEFVVVPEDTKVRLIVTAADVIHAWTIQAFGVKVDAIPGRLNELWFNASEPGIYYGQCSELCGANHAFMPIAVKVVTKDEYTAWVAQAQQRFARAGDDRPSAVASAETAAVR